ncbi:1-deoxy-D-xylulose-5-phosphate synthase N-terminal domain-containing protein [Methylobacterium sp. J-068]|uniref:1-deoxy-D-xylulose-5-phosphate synthase N-terminal domain-containing protein n=1 Tax=Methylobacterium sp. J-068 TaxID=2836649 RepID=UPI001FB91D71|nr:1-deoxy-D-xylulose-5-phosphate synthase N-terminal domain-containing protein [Methylobacterium sp. J-068]MCJ2037275.1 transketolase [Methylobacterium sp. J-068]
MVAAGKPASRAPVSPDAATRLEPGLLRLARWRLIAMHHAAGVGHLGGNLSALDAMMLVHHEMLGSQDRFVLSKGHAAGAYYVTLWSRGLIGDAELESFHGEGTRLAGHPPAGALPAIRFGTGSLGHGLSLAGGLALAARLQDRPGRVFCLTSDGEWQEGSTLEALIFCAHRRLSNLTILVDHNRLQGFGTTAEVASLDPIGRALGGFAVEIREADGHDLADMRRALEPGTDRPVVVVLHTRKGHGVPSIEGRMDSHYLPLTDAQFREALTGVREPLA